VTFSLDHRTNLSRSRKPHGSLSFLHSHSTIGLWGLNQTYAVLGCTFRPFNSSSEEQRFRDHHHELSSGCATLVEAAQDDGTFLVAMRQFQHLVGASGYCMVLEFDSPEGLRFANYDSVAVEASGFAKKLLRNYP
jgi:hypothetical protein